MPAGPPIQLGLVGYQRAELGDYDARGRILVHATRTAGHSALCSAKVAVFLTWSRDGRCRRMARGALARPGERAPQVQTIWPRAIGWYYRTSRTVLTTSVVCSDSTCVDKVQCTGSLWLCAGYSV